MGDYAALYIFIALLVAGAVLDGLVWARQRYRRWKLYTTPYVFKDLDDSNKDG